MRERRGDERGGKGEWLRLRMLDEKSVLLRAVRHLEEERAPELTDNAPKTFH